MNERDRTRRRETELNGNSDAAEMNGGSRQKSLVYIADSSAISVSDSSQLKMSRSSLA